MCLCVCLVLQRHSEGFAGGQGKVAADAEESAALYRGPEERTDWGASLDETGQPTQSHRCQGLLYITLWKITHFSHSGGKWFFRCRVILTHVDVFVCRHVSAARSSVKLWQKKIPPICTWGKQKTVMLLYPRPKPMSNQYTLVQVPHLTNHLFSPHVQASSDWTMTSCICHMPWTMYGWLLFVCLEMYKYVNEWINGWILFWDFKIIFICGFKG